MGRLLDGFGKKETAERVDRFLVKLLPHLTPGRFALVGGFAIRYQLSRHGVQYPEREFNDLDIITLEYGAVQPSIMKDFFGYHHHKDNDHEFFAFVDPETKIKIDVFTGKPYRDREFDTLIFHGQKVNVATVENQLVKTVFDIQRISEKSKVDPKQFEDTRLLMKVADLEKADEIWKERIYAKYPNDLLGSVERAESIALEHPEWVQKKPFRKALPYTCESCVTSDDFPLESMDRIYKVLGYLEG